MPTPDSDTHDGSKAVFDTTPLSDAFPWDRLCGSFSVKLDGMSLPPSSVLIALFIKDIKVPSETSTAKQGLAADFQGIGKV